MLQRIRRELAELANRSPLKSFVQSERRDNSFIEIRGKKLIDFTSWDYLSLRQNRKIKFAAQKAIEDFGVSTPSPRLISGTYSSHLHAEERVSRFLGTKSALLFSSRNQAIFSLLTSILNESDVVLCEETVQGPVHDATYLVGASFHSINFSSPNWSTQIEEEALKVRGQGRVILFLETISGITGSIAPIQDLLSVAVRSSINLIVDETYALGAIGLRGAGITEGLLTPTSPIIAVIAGLGLGVPGFGGIVASDLELISLLINRSKTLLSEPPLPAGFATSIENSLDIIELSSGARERIAMKTAELVGAFALNGFTLASAPSSPILSMRFDKPQLSENFLATLISRGFLADSVPRGTFRSNNSYVRMIVNDHHSDDHIEKLKRVISEIGHRVR